MNYTNHFNFKKPVSDELYWVDDFNDNADSIDGELSLRPTNEQVAVMLEQLIETGEITDLTIGAVSTLTELNKKLGFRVWLGTTAEFNALQASDLLEANVLYIRTDDTSAQDIRSAIAALQTAAADSGWQTLAIESPVIGAQEGDGYWAPESGGKTPRYRKIGNHVYIQGNMMADMEIMTLDWVNTGSPLVEGIAATLPASCRPSQFFYKLVPVQGARYAAILVAANGEISVAYVKDAAGNNVTEGQYWIMLDCDFLTD